jgi:hypothetical protein
MAYAVPPISLANSFMNSAGARTREANRRFYVLSGNPPMPVECRQGEQVPGGLGMTGWLSAADR